MTLTDKIHYERVAETANYYGDLEIWISDRSGKRKAVCRIVKKRKRLFGLIEHDGREVSEEVVDGYVNGDYDEIAEYVVSKTEEWQEKYDEHNDV